MPESRNVLIVAHQTAANAALLDTVHRRAEQGQARFHLVVPRRPRGMHKLVDPMQAGAEEARHVLAEALPKLSRVAGRPVTGSIGDSEPLMAIEDAVHLGEYDEIIISTLPLGVSRWLRLDLVSKARALGLPVVHVTAASQEPVAAATG
ncbi:MAG: hypothetical protein ACYC91_07575 [Solirubrobacteraceae bacterium]